MENMQNNEALIDQDDALKRIGGNVALYKKLLKRFADGNYMTLIDDALQGGNIEEAAQHAHALKGVSANLSLLRVNRFSALLEEQLKGQIDHLACLYGLREAYRATDIQIAELID